MSCLMSILLIFIQSLVALAAPSPPNLSPDFSMTVLTNDTGKTKQLFISSAYTKKNMSSIDMDASMYVLTSCAPNKHIILHDFLNDVCYPSCLYGVSCGPSDTCSGCNVPDPWFALKKSSYVGICPGKPMTQYFVYNDNSQVKSTVYYCLDKDSVPLYFRTISSQMNINVTVYVEEWDPTMPFDFQFMLPESCSSCHPDIMKKAETYEGSGFSIRNIFDLMNGRI